MGEPIPRAAHWKQLDQLCDEFESQWEAGSRPSVAEFLLQTPEPIRSRAFHDLLLIEIDHRRELGERPAVGEYVERYPDSVNEVCLLFEQLLDTQVNAETMGMAEVSANLALPNPFGDYELIEEIARGGMGAVFKARQKSLDRLVALKVILAGAFASKEHVDRFSVEARAAAKLRHSGIVAVYEFGQVGRQHYFSMEYVEGANLSTICNGKPIDGVRAAGYLKAVAEAVHYAHEQGVLHRDIKPANILIDRADRVQITDFGLAKHSEAQMELTATGQIIGTPHYMAPEQARGDWSSVDRRSDVYSLGAVLYTMLSGRPPHTGESTIATLLKVIQEEPRPLGEVNPEGDLELQRICAKCLAKNPAHRYATALELAKDLEQFLSRGIMSPVTPAKRIHEVRQPPTNRRKLVGFGGLAAGLLLAATVIIIKVGKEAVTVKTDEDTIVRVEDGRVTVESGAKSIVVQADPASTPTKSAAIGPSAFDTYRREDIDKSELAVAGGGDPANAPKELVGIIGTSRPPLGDEEDARATLPLVIDAAIITGYDISPDAERIVTINSDGTASVWEVATRKAIHTFERRTHGFVDVAIAPDGKTVALFDVEVYLFNLMNGRRIPFRLALTVNARRVWFSPQGKLLATTSKQEPQLVLSDVSTGTTVQQITLENSPNHDASYRVEFTPDESQIAIAHDRDLFIRFFDVNTGKETRAFELPSWTETMDLSVDGSLLAARGWVEYHRGQLFDLQTNELVREFEPASQVAIRADNRILATRGSDTIRLWPLDQIGIPAAIKFGHPVDDMRFAPDGRHLLVFNRSGTIYVLRIS